MPKRIFLLLALAGALAVVPAAAAVNVQIANGDTVDVVGTKIACFFDRGTEQGIVCYLATNKGRTKGTYGIGISSTGDAIVTKVNKLGAPITMWFSRKKASARVHSVRYFELTKGDSFGFRVNKIDTGCNVLDLSNPDPKFSGRRVVCFRSIKGKPLPNSYGVVISNKFVGSFRFDAKGNVINGNNAYAQLQPS